MDSDSASFAEKLNALLADQTAQWAILLAASFLLLFINAYQSGLYGDALIYAGEARLIADSGEYFTLRFGQELNHHGPLLFWLAAATIKLLGPTPFAATLFSRLFGIGCVVLTGWLGTHLFGRNAGWFAALALVTCYTFTRNTTTLRMDSAVTFGVLLAMLGYFRGEKWWGAPLFFLGIAFGVLAKSLPGFLPLFLAPLHALLAGTFHWPWKRPARRWLYWSPLLILAISWWGYLAWSHGSQVFVFYLNDFSSADGQAGGVFRLHRFLQTYLLDFGVKFLPWIAFTVFGLGALTSAALNSNKERSRRADAALLLAWILAVLIAGGLKPSQYQRYWMPALPALAVATAIGVVRLLKDRMPTWIPATVAAVTIIAAGGFTALPIASQGDSSAKLSAMAELINHRLAPGTPVPILTLKGQSERAAFVPAGDRGRCRFYFGREARPLTLTGANDEMLHGRLTMIVPKEVYGRIAGQLKLDPLIKTDFWILAETTPA
jgi:4-amino-4-deoxy-L-arabinose transferase-like glycosyltransferase